jgi:hypothetical protein
MDTATRRRTAVAATVVMTGLVVAGLAVLATRRPAETVEAGAPPGSTGVTPEPPAPTLTTLPDDPDPSLPGPCTPGAAVPAPAGEPTPATSQAVLTTVVGCAETDAEPRARAAGWTIRVVHRDGEDLMGTMDYRTDRLNLTVEDGRVTAATIG